MQPTLAAAQVVGTATCRRRLLPSRSLPPLLCFQPAQTLQSRSALLGRRPCPMQPRRRHLPMPPQALSTAWWVPNGERAPFAVARTRESPPSVPCKRSSSSSRLLPPVAHPAARAAAAEGITVTSLVIAAATAQPLRLLRRRRHLLWHSMQLRWAAPPGRLCQLQSETHSQVIS